VQRAGLPRTASSPLRMEGIANHPLRNCRVNSIDWR
jgi:hypothetical protein